MLFYINTSEHEFRKWLDTFFQNTPLVPLSPPNSRLILGAPQPSISLFREPEIIIPAKRRYEQSENDLVNISERTRWLLERVASKSEYSDIRSVLSISIKPIGLGQRIRVSITCHDWDVSQITQTLINQIGQRWTDTILQADDTLPAIKRNKFLFIVDGLNDFERILTKEFVPAFRPLMNVQEITCEPRTVYRVFQRSLQWHVYPHELRGMPANTYLTINNQPYQYEYSRAWVLTAKLVKTTFYAWHGFDINLGVTKTGAPSKSHLMIWEYPETFSTESEIVLQNFLQSFNDAWDIKKIEPNPNVPLPISSPSAINGAADVLSIQNGSDTLRSGNTAIQIAPPTTDKEGKRKPGKPRNKDHEWAREQVYKLGRPPNEVYPEWVERIGSDRALALSDDRDLFRQLLKTKPKGS